MIPDRDGGVGGPTVGRVLDGATLVEVAALGPISVARPGDGRDLAVLRAEGGDASSVVELAERLWWLDGRGPAPRLVASGRDDAGAEVIVVEMGASAAPVIGGMVPLSPETVAEQLATSLRVIHALPVDDLLVDAGTELLFERAHERVTRGRVAVAAEGPYAGRSPVELVEVLGALFAELGAGDASTVIHGSPGLEHLWFGPSSDPVFTGWESGGGGDPHHDLAVAAASVARHYGPALVAPLLEAYGLADVDARRLDAHQLLAHLLR